MKITKTLPEWLLNWYLGIGQIPAHLRSVTDRMTPAEKSAWVEALFGEGVSDDECGAVEWVDEPPAMESTGSATWTPTLVPTPYVEESPASEIPEHPFVVETPPIPPAKVGAGIVPPLTELPAASLSATPASAEVAEHETLELQPGDRILMTVEQPIRLVLPVGLRVERVPN